jgi:L-lactate dehydrogenase complex protein LldF
MKGPGVDEQTDSLPYASSLCGACYEVCPVKIDIPSVLVDLRAQVVDAHRGGVPSATDVAMRGAATVLTSGRRLGFAGRFTRFGTWTAGKLPIAGAWTGARDLPPGPRESFRRWWKRTGGGTT